MAESKVGSPAAVPTTSVIVPFHRGRAALQQVLSAILDSDASLEVIVVANGCREDLAEVAATPRVRLLEITDPCGPAVARNRGSELAAGATLVFVDADVIPHATAIPAIEALLAADPGVAGVFGAYDHTPVEPGFYSQYRNLAHAFVHERGRPEARTFWAGLGAVRTSVFRAVAGFDERFVRPSIEDIDLGYRLSAAGHRLRLDPRIRGTHLKRWTFRSAIVIDVRDRGVPWTQALLKYGAAANDLNISWTGRASVMLAYLFAGSLLGSPLQPAALTLSVASLAAFATANRELLRDFVRVRGRLFALGVLGGQVVHHLCNGVSLVVGTILWGAQRLVGWKTRWTLPADPWPPGRQQAGAQ